MAISMTLGNFLIKHQVNYDLIPHPHTGSSMETAQEAHIPGSRLAKAVILKEDDHYLMVVIPSVEHVDLTEVRQHFGAGMELASEAELSRLFPDCSFGAIPPTGAAWGLDTYLDECLLDEPEIFFEAGDHEDLVRVSGEQFVELMEDAERGHYGHTI